MSEPIAYADLWRPVMQAAGFRCQCTGECGNEHAKAQGRCPREHDQHASKHRGPAHLIAASADLAMPVTAAARTTVGELRAWCPSCFTAARRLARNTQAAAGPAPDGLFDL
ncbi:hypothetical protein ABZ769_30570 [Streptomyces olivoreticuli]